MAYKNQKKNKNHVATLQNVGWRLGNKKKAKYRKNMASLSNVLSTNEKEEVLRSIGKL